MILDADYRAGGIALFLRRDCEREGEFVNGSRLVFQWKESNAAAEYCREPVVRAIFPSYKGSQIRFGTKALWRFTGRQYGHGRELGCRRSVGRL
jgi:hypothetical protein